MSTTSNLWLWHWLKLIYSLWRDNQEKESLDDIYLYACVKSTESSNDFYLSGVVLFNAVHENNRNFFRFGSKRQFRVCLVLSICFNRNCFFSHKCLIYLYPYWVGSRIDIIGWCVFERNNQQFKMTRFGWKIFVSPVGQGNQGYLWNTQF